MCGIIYAKNLLDSSPVNQVVKSLYINQKDRGSDGFGFVGLSSEEYGLYKALKEKELVKYINKHLFDEILFHHRFPTSTANALNAAHPFEIDYNKKTYYFIHNGIINNPEALKAEHDELGLKYSSFVGNTFNDSEALAYAFVLSLNGVKTKTTPTGSAALVCLQVDQKTKRAERLYFYTNGESPLKMYRDKSIFIISSETGNDITPNKLYFFQYSNRRVYEQKTTFDVPSFKFNYTGGGWSVDDFGAYRSTVPYSQSPNVSEQTDSFMRDDLLAEIDMYKQEIERLNQDYYQATLKGDKAAMRDIYEQITAIEDDLDYCESELGLSSSVAPGYFR